MYKDQAHRKIIYVFDIYFCPDYNYAVKCEKIYSLTIAREAVSLAFYYNLVIVLVISGGVQIF